ncbi:MAG TPA: pteridine reductase [Burkholderiales bacterium]|nr:pteridine reductase [Burkholderiales bacterium]
MADAALSSRVVLVTGAARRLGAAVARRLHAAGASVVLHYRNAEADAAALEKELNAARAGSAVRVKADLLAPVAPQALVGAARQRFGRLDFLINNASAFYPTRLGEIEPGHWEELVGSNLRAPLFLAQAAAQHLKLAGGAIVNIADIHAERPLKGYVVYSVAKAGLVALTKSLALELAPGVRVNAVAPGAIAWPEDGQFESAERARIIATTPLGRTGTADEVAQAVHFLCTASFVTGQIVAVDGGRSVFL